VHADGIDSIRPVVRRTISCSIGRAPRPGTRPCMPCSITPVSRALERLRRSSRQRQSRFSGRDIQGDPAFGSTRPVCPTCNPLINQPEGRDSRGEELRFPYVVKPNVAKWRGIRSVRFNSRSSGSAAVGARVWSRPNPLVQEFIPKKGRSRSRSLGGRFLTHSRLLVGRTSILAAGRVPDNGRAELVRSACPWTPRATV